MILCSCENKIVETTVSIVPQPVSIEQREGFHTYKSTSETIDSTLSPEEYVLIIKKGKVLITGGSEAGIFYGKETLSQILNQSVIDEIPNITIKDKPQFQYRGAHLDCCRTFYTVKEVKEFLDIMAIHKLNKFHWHLTEDQGWCFESKKYPKLTEIGAWREGTIKYRDDNNEEYDDGVPCGGFYTQEEMKDIVKYASERNITIIPEIEMPGHSLAALASYPELGCKGGPYKVGKKLLMVTEDILCVGKDNTIQFLKDILDEVCDIFPGEYIHIGGDESPRTCWEKCPFCQARMKAEGLTKESQLQSWLNSQIETYLNSKGRRIIGWDEILEGGVTETATIMSWRGSKGGQDAAKQGNDAVMSPSTHCYFDYYQTNGRRANGEHRCLGVPITLRHLYSYNPYEGIEDKDKFHIIGVQCNMWSEFTYKFSDVMYQELPRMAALAEIAWNGDGRTSYEDFVNRIEIALLPIYKEKNWNYADFAFREPAVE